MALLAACGSGAPTPEPLTLVIKASEFHFETPTIAARVGQTVTIRLENAGVLEHSLGIDALGVKLDNIRPGQTGEVTFTPQRAGTYTYECKVAGHAAAGMAAALRVTP
jgi:plastocyanin